VLRSLPIGRFVHRNLSRGCKDPAALPTDRKSFSVGIGGTGEGLYDLAGSHRSHGV
jgi:hypothetical protein